MSLMDGKDNTLLERGADNDIVRLRWRLQIRENIIGRLVAENQRLRLTDEEREAIKTAVGGMCLWMKENEVTEDESLRRRCVTLRNLLARLS
jgi:hypothetical protein